MANETITLPSGETVVIRDPKTLKQKDRAKVYAGADENLPTLERGMAMISSLLSVIIESWSFDLIPPNVKPESLGELTIADFDALQEVAEKTMPLLFPKLAKDLESESDPKALTENFNA
jgi:hypothetical protein